MPVVLRPGLNDQQRHMQINKTVKNRKNYAFSEVEHKHNNSVTSLDYARDNKSIIYVTTYEREAPINMLSHSKTQQVGSFTHITSDFF